MTEPAHPSCGSESPVGEEREQNPIECGAGGARSPTGIAGMVPDGDTLVGHGAGQSSALKGSQAAQVPCLIYEHVSSGDEGVPQLQSTRQDALRDWLRAQPRAPL